MPWPPESLRAMLRTTATRWVGQSLDLLYPPRCVLCEIDTPPENRPEGRGAPVCTTCATLLTERRIRCRGCGDPWVVDQAESAGPAWMDDGLVARPAADPRAALCRRCAAGRRLVDGIVVLGGYEGDLRDRVLAAKRPGGRLVAAGLARLLADRVQAVFADHAIDRVVPVPMHWRRRLLRGCSAADELAGGVARSLGLRRVRAVRRARATRMQNELPWELRAGNVRGAFRARHGVAGRRLLLVDDVTTTGATLAACRQAADAAGAAAVYAAVVARADRADDP